MRNILAAIFVIGFVGTAAAQSAPAVDPNATVTLTVGDLDALINFKLAEARAQSTIAKIQDQIKPTTPEPQMEPESTKQRDKAKHN